MAGVVTGSFPLAARRTRRATLTAGSPLTLRGVEPIRSMRGHGDEITAPR